MTYHATRLNNNPITIIKTIMTAMTIYTCLIITGVQQRRTDGIIIQHVWRTPYNNNIVAAYSFAFLYVAFSSQYRCLYESDDGVTPRESCDTAAADRTIGRTDGRTQGGRDERTARESVAAEGTERERVAAVKSVDVAKVDG